MPRFTNTFVECLLTQKPTFPPIFMFLVFFLSKWASLRRTIEESEKFSAYFFLVNNFTLDHDTASKKLCYVWRTPSGIFQSCNFYLCVVIIWSRSVVNVNDQNANNWLCESNKRKWKHRETASRKRESVVRCNLRVCVLPYHMLSWSNDQMFEYGIESDTKSLDQHYYCFL